MGRTNRIVEIDAILFELRQENEMLDDLVIMFFNKKKALKQLKKDIGKWIDIYNEEDELVKDKIIDLVVELNNSFYSTLHKYLQQNN